MQNTGELNEFFSKNKIELNEEQLKAVGELDKNILLLAVPGSGKTTALVSRLGFMIEAKGIDPKNILTLTFSKNGVRDLKERFGEFFPDSPLPKISTIHAFAFSVIREVQKLNKRESFKVLDNPRPVLREIYLKVKHHLPTEKDMRDLESNLSYIKNLCLNKKEAQKILGKDYKIRTEYETYKENNRLLDFDDMLLYTHKLLKKNPALLERIKRRYRYILVDEAQDNSLIQHAIIKQLVGTTGNLFMVADEDQSIYGFRGAFPEAVLKFKEKYKNPEILRIQKNYRSPETMTELANSFIRLNTGRYKKEMTSDRKQGNKPDIRRFNDLNKRDEFIVENAKNKEDLAILYRNNDSAIPVVDLLEREGIPFRLTEQSPTFFSNPVLRDISSFYRFAKDPTNIAAFRDIWYKFFARIPKEFVESLNFRKDQNVWNVLFRAKDPWLKDDLKEAKRLFDKLKKAKPENFFSIILYDLDYMQYLEYKDSNGGNIQNDLKRLESLRRIAMREKSMTDFFKRLRFLRKKIKEPDESQGVTLSTIHSAKGLEFDTVYLIDFIDSIIPAGFNEEDDKKKYQAYKEEVRLFYVAVTRAKNELDFLLINKNSRKYRDNTDSPFIDLYFNQKAVDKELERVQKILKSN